MQVRLYCESVSRPEEGRRIGSSRRQDPCRRRPTGWVILLRRPPLSMASRCHHSLGSGESAALATEPSASISRRTPNLLPGAEHRCSDVCLWKSYMPAGQHAGISQDLSQALERQVHRCYAHCQVGSQLLMFAIGNSLPALLAIAESISSNDTETEAHASHVLQAFKAVGISAPEVVSKCCAMDSLQKMRLGRASLWVLNASSNLGMSASISAMPSSM